MVVDTVESELIILLESIDNKIIVAHDTHRWVKTDGFYELEFTLVLDGLEIYLTTITGDSELEDEYSENNPTIIGNEQFLNLLDPYHTVSVFNTIKDYLNNNYEYNDYRFNYNQLNYQDLL